MNRKEYNQEAQQEDTVLGGVTNAESNQEST